ncbi:MAG: hypothetical protein ACKVZJ_07065 [Phycisphaerales bacterium]
MTEHRFGLKPLTGHAARALLAIVILAPHATAGTQVGSGTASVWGRPTQYATWDVLPDSGPGLVGFAEGRVRDMAWWNGRLYCGARNDAQDAGPWFYTPGSTSSLAAPTEINFTFTGGDARRWLNNSTIAINTSGTGFGAFTPGAANPTLALVGTPSNAPSSTLAYTVSHAGPVGTMSATTALPPAGSPLPTSLHYDAQRDRFVTVQASLGNPSQSILRTYPHDAAGLLAPDTSLTINVNGLNGLDRVSAAFAAIITNGAVNQSAYLALRRETTGISGVQVELLMLEPTTGSILSRTPLPLPAFDLIDPTESKASAIAVDEAGGRLFVSDFALGTIHVLTIPAPGAIAPMALGAAFARRRRR